MRKLVNSLAAVFIFLVSFSLSAQMSSSSTSGDKSNKDAALKDGGKDGAKEGSKEGTSRLTGVPKLVRTNPVTEVFFYEVSGSYVVPEAAGHNRIYNALVAAQIARKPIEIVVDPKTKNILGLKGDKVSVPVPVDELTDDEYWNPKAKSKKSESDAPSKSK